MTKPRSDVFVGEIGEEFLCTICQDVLEVPVSCTQGHPFCKSCLDGWLAVNEKCPTCNEVINKEYLTRIRTLETVIEKLPVRCKHAEATKACTEGGKRKRKASAEAAVDGCSWEGKYAELQKHLIDDCMFACVPCPNDGCKEANIQRRSLESHSTVCGYRRLPCDFCKQLHLFNTLDAHKATCNMATVKCNCGASIIRGQLSGHKDTTCPEASVTCPFLAFGCNVKSLKRRGYDQHQVQAAQKHSELMASRLAALDYAERDIQWTIKTVAAKQQANRYIYSDTFSLELGEGPVMFRLKTMLGVDKMGLFISHYVSEGESVARFPLFLVGSVLTLTHPGGLQPDNKVTFTEEERDKIDAPGTGWGWDNFCTNWKSYVVDDQLLVKAHIRVKKVRSNELVTV